MDSRKSNKIIEIVKLQQILKKWRKLANSPKSIKQDNGNNNKSIKFLKKTLSFSETNLAKDSVPKGFLAVCVGEELKRFVIPMEFLGRRAFDALLKEAEEEFGFQQEGILRIPCKVSVFEEILEALEGNKDAIFLKDYMFTGSSNVAGCCSSESQLANSRNPQSPICR